MKKFFAEFKEFAMRGNVMDMAVGVIIGTAFGKITTSLVNDVFMPLIGLLVGGVDLGQLNIVLKPEVLDEAGQVVTEAVTLGIGTFLLLFAQLYKLQSSTTSSRRSPCASRRCARPWRRAAAPSTIKTATSSPSPPRRRTSASRLLTSPKTSRIRT